MRLSIACAFFCVIGAILVDGSPPSIRRIVASAKVPSPWKEVGFAPLTQEIQFELALRQRNLDFIERRLLEIADPSHADYQQWMSVDQLQSLVSPSADDKQTLLQWLAVASEQSRETPVIVDHGDALAINSTVSFAASLLRTRFYMFSAPSADATTKREIVRAIGSYELHSLVDFALGVTGFPQLDIGRDRRHHATRFVHPQQQATPTAQPGDLDSQVMVPQTMYNLYNIRSQQAGAARNTSQGVVEFVFQSFSPAELIHFGEIARVKTQAPLPHHIIGPNRVWSPEVQAALDTELLMSTNIEADPWFWLESGDGWMYQFVAHAARVAELPSVLSISYAWYELDNCAISPFECGEIGVDDRGYVQRVNYELLKIAARGITVVVATSLGGAHTRTDPLCQEPHFRADFPASSPWVVAVGGTEWVNNTADHLPDDATPPICRVGGNTLTCMMGDRHHGSENAVSFDVSGFCSGGGFSDVAAMPAFQRPLVYAYLNQTRVPLPPASYYNASNRAFPDVSAVAHNCLAYNKGDVYVITGTACAAPVWAGVLSLLNQVALRKTGKPLGYVNPLLYRMKQEAPEAFYDVTVGDNRCTEYYSGDDCLGFYCTTGWTPVTGLGTPNVQRMLDYLDKVVFP